jgi:hypothetical protein
MQLQRKACKTTRMMHSLRGVDGMKCVWPFLSFSPGCSLIFQICRTAVFAARGQPTGLPGDMQVC